MSRKNLLIVLITLIIVSCNIINQSSYTNVGLQCILGSRALGSSNIKSLTLEVTGSGMGDINKIVSSGLVSLDVPQGKSRKFVVRIEMNDGTIYSGETTADVDGDSITIKIKLKKVLGIDIEEIGAKPILFIGIDEHFPGYSDSYFLTTVFIPENTANKSVVWSSSNTSIATIDSNGVITPLTPGEVTITVTSVDGGFSDSITGVVKNYVHYSNITIVSEVVSLDVGETTQLTYTATPDDASVADFDNGLLYWTSTNPAYGSVDKNGLVTSHSLEPFVISLSTISTSFSISLNEAQ